MRQIIYNLLYNQEGLTLKEIAVRLVMAALLGAVIYLSYAISHRGTIYSKKFNVSLLVLTILTATVMTVIGNNVALSLGMVGALSIVRFRTAIKDTRDTVYIFWTIVTGICCGVGDYLVAAVGGAVVFVTLLVLGCIKSDNRMLLIVRGSRAVESSVKALVFRLFDRRAMLRVENTTPETLELIYEISSKTLRRAEKKEPSICDAVYAIGQIEYVNLVLQNDEISS